MEPRSYADTAYERTAGHEGVIPAVEHNVAEFEEAATAGADDVGGTRGAYSR